MDWLVISFDFLHLFYHLFREFPQIMLLFHQIVLSPVYQRVDIIVELLRDLGKHLLEEPLFDEIYLFKVLVRWDHQ